MKHKFKVICLGGMIPMLVLGAVLSRAQEGTLQPPEKPSEPRFQFRARLILYTPKDPEILEETEGLTVLQSVFLDPLVEPDVLTPRGYWRRTPFDELLPKTPPDSDALKHEEPEVVVEELSEIDGRYDYRVAATAEDSNKLGELMAGHGRSERVLLKDVEGKEVEDPEAVEIYDLTVVVRVEKVYDDGFALMHSVHACRMNKAHTLGKIPLYEKKLGSIDLLDSFPSQVSSFESRTTGLKVDQVVRPGRLILLTVWPCEEGE